MKKNVLMLLLAGLISTTAFAQRNQRAVRSTEKPTPEKMAEMRTNRMKEKLALTDDQYKKVYAINLEQIKENQSKQAERQANAKAERVDLQKKYANVLTPDQMKKLEEQPKHQPQQNRMRGRSEKRPAMRHQKG